MKLSRAAAAASDARWTQAANDAGSAKRWLPWSTQPWQQLGEAQLAQGNTHAARTSFMKAIAKDSSDWNLWFDLARASTGKAQQTALAHATRLNPLSPEIKELKLELANEGTINGS
jgi:Flp pilus assembly protein TadD